MVIDVHARDVVEMFSKNKITELTDFQWISQLRYYLEVQNSMYVMCMCCVGAAYVLRMCCVCYVYVMCVCDVCVLCMCCVRTVYVLCT